MRQRQSGRQPPAPPGPGYRLGSGPARPSRRGRPHPVLRIEPARRRVRLRAPARASGRAEHQPERSAPRGPGPPCPQHQCTAGWGASAATLPRPRRATTAWAEIPHGPSQVTTAPAPGRHRRSIPPATGRQRRIGARSPRVPATPRLACTTAGATGRRPSSAGPGSRRDPIPARTPVNASTPARGRIPTAASTSIAASAIFASHLARPGALNSTSAGAGPPTHPTARAPARSAAASRSGFAGRSIVSAISAAHGGTFAGPTTW